uniref:Uncharacterized protein n=1 Tax=Glossina palpalis gambiensis TaxID=67801 RepID=A0A1B0BW22_9MUSC
MAVLTDDDVVAIEEEMDEEKLPLVFDNDDVEVNRERGKTFGVMPTILPPPVPPCAMAIPGVMPTIEPPVFWPKGKTSTSLGRLIRLRALRR